jgi:hypothetical protein
MNYGYQIQGRYFLVALFSINVMTIPPVLFIIKSTPHDNLVLAGALAYMLLNTAGMYWCLWAALPEPLPTYTRFQNFLYRRRAGKPWLQPTVIAVLTVNLCIGIVTRSGHGHHGDLTGQASLGNWLLLTATAVVLLMQLWPLPPEQS